MCDPDRGGGGGGAGTASPAWPQAGTVLFLPWAVSRQATAHRPRLLISPFSRRRKEGVPEARSGRDNCHFHTHFRGRLLSEPLLTVQGGEKTAQLGSHSSAGKKGEWILVVASLQRCQKVQFPGSLSEKALKR